MLKKSNICYDLDSHKPKDNLCVAERKAVQVLPAGKDNITAALNNIKKSEDCIPSGRLIVQDVSLGLQRSISFGTHCEQQHSPYYQLSKQMKHLLSRDLGNSEIHQQLVLSGWTS